MSSFTPTTQSVQSNIHRKSVGVSACSCETSSSMNNQIKILETRIQEEKKARMVAQRELKATARELDLMEQLLMRREKNTPTSTVMT